GVGDDVDLVGVDPLGGHDGAIQRLVEDAPDAAVLPEQVLHCAGESGVPGRGRVGLGQPGDAGIGAGQLLAVLGGAQVQRGDGAGDDVLCLADGGDRQRNVFGDLAGAARGSGTVNQC